MRENEKNVIDFGRVFKTTWAKRKTLFIVWVVVFALSCLLILPIPRYYKATVVLAPEIGDASGEGLSSIASNFGINLNMGLNQDAIYPTLYPDLISSKEFLVSLFDIKVKTLDGEINCDLHTYLLKHQKDAFYNYPFTWAKRKMREWTASSQNSGIATDAKKIDPFLLSEQDSKLTLFLESIINCSVNKKTDVVTISVTCQDPLVAATLADSVCQKLQTSIINYRTSKAKNDVNYYTSITKKAKVAYDKSVIAYSSFCDRHRGAVLQSVLSEQTKLENEMSMCYSTYQAMETQLRMSKAKLQERTPAFTKLQGSSVPIKPAGPKRMLFIIAMLILSTGCTIVWFSKDEFLKVFASR